MSHRSVVLLRACAICSVVAILCGLFAPIALAFAMVGMVPVSGTASIWQISPVVCVILTLITGCFAYLVVRYPKKPWRGPCFVSGILILLMCVAAAVLSITIQVGVIPHPAGTGALIVGAAALLCGSWFATGKRLQFGLLTVIAWTCCFCLLGLILTSLE